MSPTFPLRNGECIGYDRDSDNCLFAAGMSWLYNNGKPGTKCPYDGSVKKCNEHYHSLHFETRKQLIAWVKYGIEPQQNIPFSELCLEGKTLTGILLNGARVIRPGGIETVIKEDGKEHPLPKS